MIISDLIPEIISEIGRRCFVFVKEDCKTMSASAVSSSGGGRGGGGASSDLRSQVIKHCTSDSVIPPPPLEEFSADRRFRIMSYDMTTFNSFNIMEKETEQDDLFHLREEILEVVEDEGENSI